MALNVPAIDPNEFATLNAIAHQNYAAQQPQVAAPGGGNIIDNLVHGLVSPLEYFGNAVFANPIRELSAQLSGNKQAYQNALQQSNQNLGLGKNGNDLGGGLETLGGNAIGLGTTLLAPEAKVGIIPNLVQGAKIGALAGVGSSMANKGSASDVVKGGLEGALGGGALGGATGTVGKVFSGVSGAAADRAASTAAKQAEAKAVTQEAPFQGIGKAATKYNLLGPQGVLQKFNDLGLSTTPADMAAAANVVTGKNGVASSAVRDLLAGVDNVDTSNVMNDAKAAIAKETVHLGNVEDKSSAANGALRTIRNTMQAVGNNGQGSLTGKMDANSVFNIVQDLENRVDELGGTKATGANGAEARVLKATAASLKSKLAGVADAPAAALSVTPEDVQYLASKQGATVSPELAQHLANGITSAQSLQDLRSLQKPFFNASKLADAADTAAGGRFTKPVSNATTPGDIAANIGTNLALQNHFGIAQNAGRLVSKSGVIDKALAGAGKVSNAAASVAGKIPATALPQAERTVGAMIGQNASTPAPTLPTTPSTLPNSPSDLSAALATAQPQSSSPFDPANVQSSIMQIAAHGGTLDDITKFLSIASAINSLQNTQQKPLSAVQQQQANNAVSALGDLGTLQNAIQTDPNITLKDALPGGSLVQGLTGTTDYNTAKQNIVDVIARLRSGAAITNSEANRYMSMLPALGDSQQSALNKLQRLQAILTPFANPRPASSDLISALGGA